MFLAFAASVRDGEHSTTHQPVRSQTVSETLREVATVMEQYDSVDPRRLHPSQWNLDKEFQSYFRKLKEEDPASQPQLALPNSTVKWIRTNCGPPREAK